MAVYTAVAPDEVAALLDRYGIAPVHSMKGIAEGVENSNYLVDAGEGPSRARYILTLYERRVDVADLPFFIALTEHLSARGCPVARMLPDRDGRVVQQVADRAACLIQFLDGLSPTHPTPAQAVEAGRTLATLHLAGQAFADHRLNPFAIEGLAALALLIEGRCDDMLPNLAKAVAGLVDAERLIDVGALPSGVIHADAFPDNLLFSGDRVSGVIDFYFACNDALAWDYAVMHSAWCFNADNHLDPAMSRALSDGYQAVRPFTAAERAALPHLAQRAAMRFTLTRAMDWLETPEDALVQRKDPRVYWQRLDSYRTLTPDDLLGA